MPAPIKPSRSSALDAREPMWIVAFVTIPAPSGRVLRRTDGKLSEALGHRSC